MVQYTNRGVIKISFTTQFAETYRFFRWFAWRLTRRCEIFASPVRFSGGGRISQNTTISTKLRQGIADGRVCARSGDRPRRGGRRTPPDGRRIRSGGPLDGYPPVAYNIAMIFIETPIFTKRIQKAMDDDAYAALQQELK